MPDLTTTAISHRVDDAGLAILLSPRDDLYREDDLGDGRFGLAQGPFTHYTRTVEVEPASDGDGLHSVTETVRWRLAIPIWWPLFRPIIGYLLRNRPVDAEAAAGAEGITARGLPWWAPPAVFDSRSSAILSWLCGLSLFVGYLGTLITQTMTFAASEFDAGSAAQGTTLAAVRVGVLLSAALMILADRRGRTHVLVAVTVVGGVSAAAGALAPGLVVLGATQLISRACSTALALILAVLAAEEMPAGGRAFAASVLAMTAALGAGVAVLLLPLAQIAPWSWRLLYVVPVLALPLFVVIGRRLPESQRFTRTHRSVPMRGHRGRLLLLAIVAFLGLLFYAPNTQFQNDYLTNEHGFAPYQLTIFTLVTGTPAGIGVVVGGWLADTRGRRLIGVIGTIGGSTLLAATWLISPPWLGITTLLGSMVAALTVPALAVYGPELFPTSLRAKANGIISVAGVAGSALGLWAAGQMQEHFGRYGPGMAILAAGPWVVALLVITLYPETAHQSLEDLNPEDAPVLPPPTPFG